MGVFACQSASSTSDQQQSGGAGPTLDGIDGGVAGSAGADNHDSTGTGVVCTGDWQSSCECHAADRSDTSHACFVVQESYPCCATRNIAVGEPGYSCSCTPDLPMKPASVSCGQYADSLSIGCKCSTSPLDTYGKMEVDHCSGTVLLYDDVVSCYAVRTDDDWTCTCPPSVNAKFPPPGTPVPDCTPPADLNVRSCPDGTYATDNCDGNCHDEQCNGCSGQMCDANGCEGKELVCSDNKCISIPAGGHCGFSNLP